MKIVSALEGQTFSGLGEATTKEDKLGVTATGPFRFSGSVRAPGLCSVRTALQPPCGIEFMRPIDALAR